jgi:hypothetical protein
MSLLRRANDPEGNSLFQIIFIFLRLLSQEQARRYVSLEVRLCHPSNIVMFDIRGNGSIGILTRNRCISECNSDNCWSGQFRPADAPSGLALASVLTERLWRACSSEHRKCRLRHPRAFFARGWDFMNAKFARSFFLHYQIKTNPKWESSRSLLLTLANGRREWPPLYRNPLEKPSGPDGKGRGPRLGDSRC